MLILKFASKPFANSESILGRISNLLNQNNTLSFDCIGLDKKGVDVYWLPELADSVLVIRKGEMSRRIGYEYGRNRFEMVLNDSVRLSVDHFKTNNWHSHQYFIEVEKSTTGYQTQFKAMGPDSSSFVSNYDLKGKRVEAAEK